MSNLPQTHEEAVEEMRELKVHCLKRGFFELTLCGTDSFLRTAPVAVDPKLVTCRTCLKILKKKKEAK